MSDVYSDLNVKNGSKIVLGESGVAISSSGCVVLDSGCTYSLSDVATCGDYLPVTTDDSGNYYVGGSNVRITDEISFVKDVSCSTDDITEYTVSGKLIAGGNSVDLVSGCIVVIDAPGGACIRSNKGVEIQSGCSLFKFPSKGNGEYTLATTDDVNGGSDVLKLCCSTIQTVSGLVHFSCGINVNDIGISHPISLRNNNCFAFYNGATFQLPQKEQCGTYTLATTEDITSGGTISGDYLPATYESSECVPPFYDVEGAVQFSGYCIYLTNPGGNKGRILFNSAGSGEAGASFVEGGFEKGSHFLCLEAGCIFFRENGACFRFPTKDGTSNPYTLVTTDDIYDSDSLKLCCSNTQVVCGPVCFSGSISVNYLTVNNPINLGSICFVCSSGRTFQLPNKECGTYTLATTDDICGSVSGSGCTYPTCYPLYYSCCVVGELYYDGKKVLLESKGIDINIEASNDFVVKAGCSTYFMCDACFSAFCVFVPSHLPYMGGKVQSTIVTSPGYTESGCGLQICVLTQSEYSSMSQHGMTTLYFIKPENYS